MHNCLSFIDNNHMLHNLADVFRPVGTFSVTAVCLQKTSHKTYAETHVSVDPHCLIAYWLSCFAEQKAGLVYLAMLMLVAQDLVTGYTCMRARL